MFDLAGFGDNPCLIDHDGLILTYSEVDRRVESCAARFRDGPGLLLLGCENDVETIVHYLAALRANCPVLLIQDSNEGAVERFTEIFRPQYVRRAAANRFVETGNGCPVHEDLAILLSTSGTTGAAKAVRLSRGNILSNAASIAEYLEIGETDRAALTLPFHYSYGMSVINSHLYAGAAIWLSAASVAEPQFWEAFAALGCTSFPGVPHSFQLLHRSGFDSRLYPSLRHVTQAGGHLPEELVRHFSAMATRDEWRFYVMYGQTEASPRMSYVPPDLVADHPGSIGVPIPGGQFRIEVEDSATGAGELVYSGTNVMMGYALSAGY
ncbi:MAG: AMP-binding protein, partial [Sphingobium sp.]